MKWKTTYILLDSKKIGRREAAHKTVRDNKFKFKMEQFKVRVCAEKSVNNYRRPVGWRRSVLGLR